MSYDKSQHVHVGYYEQRHDLEAVALKVKGRKLWHVFFPFEDYGFPVPSSYRDAPQEPGCGLLIFSVADRQAIENRFVRWVAQELTPLLTARSA